MKAYTDIKQAKKLTYQIMKTEQKAWSITDAKAGDVLAADPIKGYSFPFVAIYKEHKQDCFAAYCIASHAGKFCEGGNRYRIDGMRLATKEESDLLFQKIKEAGYEWNQETKELIVVQKKYNNDFGWCMECRRSMWIADAFEDPEEVYCTKKKIEIKRGDKIDCPYLK